MPRTNTANPRKTTEVAQVVAHANTILAADQTPTDPAVAKAVRLGTIALVERVLFDTHNYRGFTFLSSEVTEDGTLRPDYDDTRRRYI